MRKHRTLAIIGALVLDGCDCDEEWCHETYDCDEEGCRTVFAQILSDQQADGHIRFIPPPPPEGTYTISQADSTGNLFFGIDSDGTEFRAFLDFPLDGSNGGDVVPLEAAIVSADIEVFVNKVDLASTVQTLMDLVPFSITGLTATDFNSVPIATRTPFNFYESDIGTYVRIDATSLMAETQHQGLPDLQLRLLLDFVPEAAGLVELDDGVTASTAPLLIVEYR